MTVSMGAVLMLACFAGCDGLGSVGPSAEATPRRDPFEADMMVRFHMHENFDLLRAIEKQLVRNKLDDARMFAHAIAEAPDEPNMGPWLTYATVVRERAAALADATTIDEACAREARLASACASCHVAAGISPDFKPTGEPPKDEPTIPARMARHLWATDRLWEAIVGGDDDAWKQGIAVLASRPVDDLSTAQRPFAIRLRAFAKRSARTPDDKAALYGELLATCAGCHRASESSVP